MMLAQFEKHLAKSRLLAESKSMLLALSGGVDSIVLMHLLHRLGYHFSLAHCNFELRGNDSDADEEFCRQTAARLNLPFYTKRFATRAFCQATGLSVQMAARQLRYEWFNELAGSHGFDLLLTAHHGDDAVETLFINLFRGTGIKGLRGIPERQGWVVRPLLPFSRSAILDYAIAEQLSWREDQSNADTYYERNYIRNRLLPALTEVYPGLRQTLSNNIDHFREEAAIVDDYLAARAKLIVSQQDDGVCIGRDLLEAEPHLRPLLHYILRPFGFNSAQVADLAAVLRSDAPSGKVFFCRGHELSVGRKQLVLRSQPLATEPELRFHSLEDWEHRPGFSYSALAHFALPSPNELLVNSERLIFPLTLRPVARGDRFRPYGMKGFRLLSDYLKDQKLDRFQKQRCRVLVNGNGEIMWVVGYRSDDRYKVEPKDTGLIKLVCNV